jgi:hypothetical protein
MNHLEATQLDAVDKYLLHELDPQLRDEFEEHYFGCEDCATDVRATAAFMDEAAKEFRKRASASKSSLAPPEKPKSKLFWRPAILAFALAASLMVIVYQNVMVLPHFKSEIARLQSPELLPVVSLVGANSRGGSTPGLTLHGDSPFLLSLDLPTQDRFTSYQCVLLSPSGTQLWTVEITSQAARDTVTINAPAGHAQAGAYTLVVQGRDAGGAVIEVARYHFDVSVQP